MVYDQDIVFEDLQYLIDEKEYEAYMNLRKYKSDEFDDLGMTFQIMVDGNFRDLKKDGQNIPLTFANMPEFLNLVARYYLVDRYEGVINSFIEGFKEVITNKICKKWLAPSEISILTFG